ncbi:cyclin-T1-like isoform X2 [Physella acuta]|uniref:cyclin-T1-like isoform X2 n=1 Tax=Physella acuta TaxID=109671 RepID=UPI0027DCAF1C|nr:cyclin-T1-like isoform X2 [Physella acuta]
MEDLSCNFKWLFDEEKLRNTPSVVENGITTEQELTFRQKQAMLIQTIGLKSGLTQLAVNTSVIFMHRFYMFRSVKSFPRVHLALGLAFAGGKVEESARKLEHLIRTAVDIIRTNKNREFLDKTDPFTYEMDSQYRVKMDVLCQNNCNIESPAYQEMRKLVLECETEIYAVIGFQLQIVHPHNYVIRMCALLGAENIKDISQYAYNLATASSQLTMLCLKYTPETIATMCLNIASKAHSVKFVSMKDPNVKWYQVLHSQTDIAEIEAVSEEFLQCIKGCPLLPSWMTNLGRMSRVANNRAMPGPARGPGVASASTSQGARPSHAQPITSSAATASIPQPPVATALPPSNHSVKQVVESQQLANSAPAQDVVNSPNGKPPITDFTNGAAPADNHSKDPLHISHSRTAAPSSSVPMRPPQTAASSNAHNQQQQHNRPHQPGSARTNNTTPGSNKPQSRHPLLPGTTTHPPAGGRPHSGSASHVPSSRPGHDSRHSVDLNRSHDPNRLSHDPSRPRDPSRPHDQARPVDPTRHSQPRSDRRSDMDQKRSKAQPTREEAMAYRQQVLRNAAEYTPAVDLNESSAHTPPPQTPSPPVKPPSPLDPPDLAVSGDPVSYPVSVASPESVKVVDETPSIPHVGSKLSLSMYRERARSRAPVEDGITDSVLSENSVFDPHTDSATNSPADKSFKTSTSHSDFTHPQTDSPNTPRLKIKVKLDPSGDRHYVKKPEAGLKLKIKPIKSDSALDDVGPSGSKSSRSSTPFEEGEIVDDASPAPSIGSERKSEGLKLRLSVPKSGDSTGNYSRRDSDHSSNGHNGDRESHRSHHHGHHHRSHQHKSKKHSSKHDRSRHESKSSKRSASALDYYEERSSKSQRMESYSSGSQDNYRSSHHSDNSSSHVLQHQNSGFSINDAFSSTMPNNIFDDDDDDGTHGHPPITPTIDPSQTRTEKFRQMLSQHSAVFESKKPPLPKGQPPSSPPPPPTPPIL